MLLSGAVLLAAISAMAGCTSAKPDAQQATTTTARILESDVRSFVVSDLLPGVDVNLEAQGCDEDHRLVCTGPLEVRLVNQADGALVQIFEMQSTYLTLGDDGLPETEYDGLYGSHVPVTIVRDVDFDGDDDLAIRNGNNGNYHGPSWDVYLAAGDGTFERNSAFTELASTGLDFPITEAVSETLTVLTKNGCCEHTSTIYELRSGMPVVARVETVYGDATTETIDWDAVKVPASVCGGEGTVPLDDGTGLVSSATFIDAWRGHDQPIVADQVLIAIGGPIAWGDIDEDGRAEAIVPLWCENGGGTAGGQLAHGLAVYRGGSQAGEVLGVLETTQRPDGVHASYFDNSATRISPRSIGVSELWYGPADSTAGPTGRAHTEWSYEGETFVAGTPTVYPTCPDPESSVEC